VGGTGTTIGRPVAEEAPEAVQTVHVHGRKIVIAELEYDGSDSVRTGDAVRGEGHKEPGCLDHEQTDKLHFLPLLYLL